MKIEVLYPELCTLYGDKGNTKYLQLCLPEAEFISTQLNEKPRFLDEDVELCYMCSMSEKSQEVILDRLLPYKEQILEKFERGNTLFFFVGNALELLGQYIQREDGSRVNGLGFLDSYSVRQSPNRFNTLIKAKFQDMTIIGYSSRFAHTFGIPKENAFAKVEIGSGMNPKTKQEGIRKGRMLATYLLGPVLCQNPDFTHFLLKELGAPLDTLPYEEAMRDAYNHKLKEFARVDLELS